MKNSNFDALEEQSLYAARRDARGPFEQRRRLELEQRRAREEDLRSNWEDLSRWTVNAILALALVLAIVFLLSINANPVK